MNELITERIPLGEVHEDIANSLAKELDRKPSELEFVRKGFVAESKGTDDEERSSTDLISTSDVDRDNEILLPKGADLSHYKKNPQVLFGHDYRSPPIGRAAWVKRDSASQGLLAKTIYAATEFAEEIWSLVKGGFLPARSVGFIPIEGHEPDEKEIDKHPERTGARYVYDKWELLEYSVVPVPSNRQALQVALGKGLDLSFGLIDQLGIELDDEVLDKAKANVGLDDTVDLVKLEVLNQRPEIIKLPSLVKRVVYVPKVQRVVKRPEKVLDIRKKIVMVVRDEIDRIRGRV